MLPVHSSSVFPPKHLAATYSVKHVLLLRHGPEALLSAATAASAARQLLETTSNMCGGCCGCANRGVVSQMREVIVIRDA